MDAPSDVSDDLHGVILNMGMAHDIPQIMELTHCDKDRGVGIKRYMIRIQLRLSSRGEDIVK
jgi:hypothetical protein